MSASQAERFRRVDTIFDAALDVPTEDQTAFIERECAGDEALRAEVFAGKRGPLIFGDPQDWLGLLVQAAQLVAAGNFAAADELRQQAFEAAPANPGQINGQDFEWLADADSRLGPVLEAMIDGKYY